MLKPSDKRELVGIAGDGAYEFDGFEISDVAVEGFPGVTCFPDRWCRLLFEPIRGRPKHLCGEKFYGNLRFCNKWVSQVGFFWTW